MKQDFRTAGKVKSSPATDDLFFKAFEQPEPEMTYSQAETAIALTPDLIYSKYTSTERKTTYHIGTVAFTINEQASMLFSMLFIADPFQSSTPCFIRHTQDSHCSIDPDTDCCFLCGVDHSGQCLDCFGRGFHKDTCPQMKV